MTKRVRDSPFLKNVKMYDFVPRGHTQEFENTGELEDTKQDGTVYYFDADGNVTKIIDTNGSTIEMTYDGIIHSDGKSINYNRDSQGRITSIVSPTGKTVEYTYDNNGDLTAVKDVSGYVTRFEYDDHYITNIIDPRGVNVSRNIYDDNGRLIKTIDSDGNEIVYDHDIDGRQEIITDRNGNIRLLILTFMTHSATL